MGDFSAGNSGGGAGKPGFIVFLEEQGVEGYLSQFPGRVKSDPFPGDLLAWWTLTASFPSPSGRYDS